MVARSLSGYVSSAICRSSASGGPGRVGPSRRDQVLRTGFAKRLTPREPERSLGISQAVEALGRAAWRCAQSAQIPMRSEGDGLESGNRNAASKRTVVERHPSAWGNCMNPIARYTHWLHTMWPAGTVEKLPEVREDGTTAVPGVRVVGDLTGIPLLKFSSDTGARAVQAILAEPDFAASRAGDPEGLDLAIVGAGVSGMAAALAAKK